VVGGSDRGWNETREEDGEEYMNYPYIILTLFVLVWVDDG